MKLFFKHLFYVFTAALCLQSCFHADKSTSPSLSGSTGTLRVMLTSGAGTYIKTGISATLSSMPGNKKLKTGIIKSPANHIEFNNVETGKYVVKFYLESARLSDSTLINIEPHSTKNIYLSVNNSGNININVDEFFGNDLLDYPGNPILTKYNTLSEYGAYFGRIIYDENKFKMWYANSHGNDKYDIGYAESYDGFTWYIINGVVIQPGPPGSWDSYGVRPGAVIKENNIYKMYYCGQSKPNSPKVMQIGLAVSYDGKTWYKNSVETTNAINITGITTDIMKIGATYYLYYGNNKIIGVATSSDGIHWTKTNNSIIYATELWEGGGVWSCSVIADDDRYKMLYTNKLLNAFGYAESVDGLHWTKNTSPIFTFHETNKMWPFDIRYPFVRKVGQTYYIFYSTVSPKWESKLGVAIASELK